MPTPCLLQAQGEPRRGSPQVSCQGPLQALSRAAVHSPSHAALQQLPGHSHLSPLGWHAVPRPGPLPLRVLAADQQDCLAAGPVRRPASCHPAPHSP